MEKLGIENLKIAVFSVINLAEKIEDKHSDDGKISLMEALNVGTSSFTNVVKVIKSGKQLKAEFLDLDEFEKAELLELIKAELDLQNDKVENIVEKAIELLMNLEELISAIS